MNEVVQAEQSFLGAILIEGELIKETNLEPVMLKHIGNQTIFKYMKQLEKKDIAIDLATFVSEVGQDLLTQIGGISYLSDLASSVPTTANFKHYERIILDAYKIRKAQQLTAAYAENPSNEDLLDLQNSLQALQEMGATEKEKNIRDWVMEIADEINGYETNLGGFKTDFIEYDSMTGGLQRTDLIIVAARPSMGKTAFALGLGGNHCKNGGTTHFFSLEMGSKQLVKRLISAEGRIDGLKWHNPTKMFSDNDYDRAIYAMDKVSKWDFRIYEKERTIGDLRAKIRQGVKKQPEKRHVVIIDYLQLVSGGGRFENRVQEVGHITRELKLLAKDLQVPIVLLSQLSRNVESRQDKRPMMSDIRESGNVEQDADVICFLYRDDYYDKESEKKNLTEVIVSKQRNGPTGTVELVFMKEYGKFINLERRFEQEAFV